MASFDTVSSTFARTLDLLHLSPETVGFALFLLVELTLIYCVVTFLVELLRQGLGPERLQRLLKTRTPVRGMGMAALLGAVTPFCSCSTVPLTAAMMRIGVALPVTTTFLIMSPLLNPATLAILMSLAGPAYGALYVFACFAVALGVGAAMFLFPSKTTTSLLSVEPSAGPASWSIRSMTALQSTTRSYLGILPVFLIAVAIGALLHDEVAGGALRDRLAGDAWWTVPAAVVVGVPVYASTGILLPLGTALYESGIDLGVITAFLMGATGFSIPEAIMLRKIIGTRLLAVLAGVFAIAVVLVGYGVQILV